MMLLTAPDLRIVSFGGARLVQRPDGLRERMDVRTAELLTSCRTLRQRGDVEEHYSAALTQTLLDRGLLVEERTLWSAQEIRAVEIETTTVCNWRCVYCPASDHPRPRRIMPMPLFELILKRIAECPSIRHVTLHYFNEPTIDPFFLQRVERLCRQGLGLYLFTNGSGLCKSLLKELKATGIVEAIYFTFPSANQEEFVRLTGGKGAMAHSTAMVRTAIALGFDVRLSVQGEAQEKRQRIAEICKLFSLPPAQIAPWETFDRAGSVSAQPYRRYTRITCERLCGCRHILSRLYVDVEGSLLLCDQDFDKTICFGDVRDGRFEDLLASRRAGEIKRWIFGGQRAPDELLCRHCQRMLEAQRLFATESDI